MSKVYTPREVAARWRCSERQVRNLIRKEALRAFRVGDKLIRISADAVEEYEQCQTSRNGRSDGTDPSSASPSTGTESADVIALEPEIRWRLHDARRSFTQD